MAIQFDFIRIIDIDLRKENIMSKNYTKIKNYYESGLWSIDRVWNVVGKKLGITEDEYKEITGFTYPAKEA